MFCSECGASVEDGSSFCDKCGNKLKAAAPVTQAPQIRQGGRKAKAGFFYSPAGIALVVILGVAVIAGITIGIIFLVRGGSGNSADAATMDVWNEYEEVLEDDGSTLAKIDMSNANYLFTVQEDLKKTKERVAELQKTLVKTGGTEERIRGTGTSSTRDMLADAMEEALEAYESYVIKVAEFVDALIWAVANNQLAVTEVVNNLNTMLADMQNLADEVKNTAGEFIDANELLAGTKFNPDVLAFANDIAPQVETLVAEAQASEAARLEAERQAAAAEAARLEAEKAAAEAAAAEAAEAATVNRCPSCGATEAGGWVKVNTGWHCFNCGYHVLDPQYR